MIHMKSQDLFSLKNKKKIKLSSSAVVTGASTVKYPIYPKYWNRQAQANSVSQDQKPQNAVSDQGVYLAFIQQFLDTSTGSKVDLLKF